MSTSQSLSAEGVQQTGPPISQIYLEIKNIINSIDRIGIGYDKNSPTYPGDAKDWATNIFKVDKDDKIIGVYVWRQNESADARIEAIQFLTTKTLSQKYGCDGACPFFYSSIDKNGANALLGMTFNEIRFPTENSGFVRNLKLYWGSPREEGYRFLQLGRYVGTEQSFPLFGYFNTLESAGNHWVNELREIRIWHGEKIDAIQCIYTNGKTTSKFGGEGGGLSSLKLADGEYITSIEGRAAKEIDSLTIFTNHGRRERFGGRGGGPFLWDASTSNPEMDLCLLGFFGQTGQTNTINRLAPMWAAAPPSEYTLHITSSKPTAADLQSEKIIVNSDTIDIKNDSSLSIQRTIKVEETVKTSFHYKFNQGLKLTTGWEWNAKGEAAFDVWVLKCKVEAGGKYSTSRENTFGTETGFEGSREVKLSSETRLRCPEYSIMHATVSYTKTTINDFPWTGTLTAHYTNGKTVEHSVSGTYASISCSGLDVDSKSTKLKGH